MKIQVLGCSGGIGKGVATTSFLVDDDILVDAGTGVCDMALEDMRKLRHIFVTHSHLDHIAAIPLLADTLFDQLRGNPLRVYAEARTLKVLHQHVFNWALWPDFTELPHRSNAALELVEMTPGSELEIDGRLISMITVNHSVPGVGYSIEADGKVFAFSGDTTSNENLWSVLNSNQGLDLLIVESAFADKDLELAKLAFHYCPSLLAKDLPKLKHRPKVCITHLKPGEEQLIMQECRAALPDWDLHELSSGDVFEL